MHNTSQTLDNSCPGASSKVSEELFQSKYNNTYQVGSEEVPMELRGARFKKVIIDEYCTFKEVTEILRMEDEEKEKRKGKRLLSQLVSRLMGELS